jgi:hypothetical protein
MKLIARVWDIDGGKMSAGIDLDLFMRSEEDLEFPKTDESLPFKDFLYFRKEFSEWMLFSGLAVGEGTELYDGDIVKHNKNIFVVCLRDNMGWCLIEADKYSEDKTLVYRKDNWRDWLWVFNVKKYLSVIGNVKENPELLSQSK